MIGKVLRSGGSTGGLVRYLFGGGRNGEHLEPRVVAGWDDPERLEPPDLGSGRRDFRRLVGLLDGPALAAGYSGADKPIYHLIVSSARADPVRGRTADRPLTDAEWADVAGDAMRRVGIAGRGAHWVAVRHDQPGAEHVHIVATLAAEDGRRIHPRNDFYRIAEACHAAEDRYGLRPTGASDRTAVPKVTRAEAENAQRRGVEPARTTLRREVRAAVAGADSAAGFLEQLRAAGLLVRERHSERDGALTGYAVAVPGRTSRDGQPIFYGGGKLAADLTLPKIRARWAPEQSPASSEPDKAGDSQPVARPTLTPDERAEVWQSALDAAARATAAIGAHEHDPPAAAAAAWEASDFLASAARLVDGRKAGPLSRAADAYDRAGREAYGRTPPPSAAGAGLRAAGGLLMASRVVTSADTKALLALLAQLAALSDSLTRMREQQQRAVQAAAARDAARQLRDEHTRRLQAGAQRQHPPAHHVAVDLDDRAERDPQTRTGPSRRGPHR